MSENVCCKSQWTSVDKRAALCKSYLSLLLSFDFNVPSTSCIGSTPATWSSCYDVVFSTSHLPHLYVCVVLNVINMDFSQKYTSNARSSVVCIVAFCSQRHQHGLHRNGSKARSSVLCTMACCSQRHQYGLHRNASKARLSGLCTMTCSSQDKSTVRTTQEQRTGLREKDKQAKMAATGS